MRALVLSAVLFAILLSAGCADSSTPPPAPSAQPLATATPVPRGSPTAQVPAASSSPSAAASPIAPPGTSLLTPAGPPGTSNGTPSGTGNSTPRAGITLAPRQPTATLPAAGALNVTFERSGGFTGRIESFRLKPDGSVDDGKVVLRAAGGTAAAASLAAQIAATGIYAVAPGRYMPANTCCDRFEYDLTLTQNGKSYNFVTIDSAPSAPPELVQAIRLISQYINAAN